MFVDIAEHVLFFVAVSWVSFVMAKLEIELEGKSGWAESLPTWRLPKTHWASKAFAGGRPVTGYHVWMHLFVFSILHTVFLFIDWSISIELKIISFIVLFWVFEDFLWFVLNPAYGLKNFKKERIWWHSENWFFVAPREYFIFLPLGLFLYLIANYV